jgi:hypothetical protein
MTLRTTLLQVSARLRALAGPARMDQRPHRVSIITRTWSGGYRGAGASSETSLDLPQDFIVRQVSTREIASSGGRYELGDVKVENITPAYVASDGITGGFSPADLNPVVTRNGIEILYRIAGPHAGDYQLVELESWRTYGYDLVLRRRTDTP